MPLLTKLIKSFTAVALLSSAQVFAGDIVIDNVTVNDPSNDAIGGSNYEINKMLVNWDDNDQITVDIYTNFGAHNNSDPQPVNGRGIIFGDLLLGTGDANDDYNYAFSLGQLINNPNWTAPYDSFDSYNAYLSNYYGDNKVSGYERHYRQAENTSSSYTNGGLYEISDTITSHEYHVNNQFEHDPGAVFAQVDNTSNKVAGGTWGVNNSSVDFDVLSFSFNVANIEAFQNADQLSLSWAMSCYNDAVTAVIAKATTPINAPASASALLLLGLAMFSLQRKKQAEANNFSA